MHFKQNVETKTSSYFVDHSNYKNQFIHNFFNLYWARHFFVNRALLIFIYLVGIPYILVLLKTTLIEYLIV
jgi:hypothetical protein